VISKFFRLSGNEIPFHLLKKKSFPGLLQSNSEYKAYDTVRITKTRHKHNVCPSTKDGVTYHPYNQERYQAHKQLKVKNQQCTNLNSMRGPNSCDGETTFKRCEIHVLKHNPKIIAAKIHLQFGRPIAQYKNIGRTPILIWIKFEMSPGTTDLQVQSQNEH